MVELVEHLNLILTFYFAIGCLIGGLMTWVPRKKHETGINRYGLFIIILIGWLPLAILSWAVLPFVKSCPCFTRH